MQQPQTIVDNINNILYEGLQMGISIVDVRNMVKGLGLSKQDETLLITALKKREEHLSNKIEESNSKAKEVYVKAKETYKHTVKVNKSNLITKEAKAIMSYLKIEPQPTK